MSTERNGLPVSCENSSITPVASAVPLTLGAKIGQLLFERPQD